MEWVTDNLDELYVKFQGTPLLQEVEEKLNCGKVIGSQARIKDFFRIALFSRAEAMLDEKYKRRHTKLLNIILAKTSPKLPYEMKNTYVENQIEEQLEILSG